MDAGYLVCRPRWGKSWYRDFGLPNGSIPPRYRLRFFFGSCFHPADPLDPPGSWMLATWYVGPGERRAGTEILDCQMVAFHRGIDCVFFWSFFHPADPLDPAGSWMLATWYVGPGEGRAGTEIFGLPNGSISPRYRLVFFFLVLLPPC